MHRVNDIGSAFCAFLRALAYHAIFHLGRLLPWLKSIPRSLFQSNSICP